MPPESCLHYTTHGHLGYGLNALGVVMGCVGSISINIGNNLQAKGHAEAQAHAAGTAAAPKTNLFVLGTAVFVLASIIQFVAFAFAPASVVAPLESLQFVSNVAFAKYVNNQVVTRRMLGGTSLILLGTVIAVTLGPKDGRQLFTLEQLVGFWAAPGWLIYLSFVIGLALAAELTHVHYRRAASISASGGGRGLCGHDRILPLRFALSSSLVGTQAVVQAKCAAETLKLMISGCAVEVLSSWYLYTTLVLLAGCGVLWIHRLNKALKTYDPLFIIPLLQSQYIVCATLSGE